MVSAHEIHVEPRFVRAKVKSNESMVELRKAVKERFRVSDDQAGSFAEGLLTRAVEKFGTKYLDAMSEHIERMFRLRGEAANVIEEVIGAEALSPEEAGMKLEGIFRDIKSDMEAITDPEKFAKAQPIEVPDIDLEFDLTEEGKQRQTELAAGKREPRK